MLGPVAGGLLGELGPRAPFVAAASLALFNAGFAFFTLPETLDPAKRRTFDLRGANPLAVFSELAHRPTLGHLMSVSFLDTLSGLVYPAVWAYFAVAQFGWSTATVGLSLATYGFFFALIQAGIIRVILRRMGELRTAVFGLSAAILGFLILTQLSSPVWAFLLTPLFALRAITGSTLNGLLSRRAGEDEQGALQGILSGMTGLATMIGIPLMTQIFAVATRDSAAPLNGAPFAAAAMLATLSLVLLLAPRAFGRRMANSLT